MPRKKKIMDSVVFNNGGSKTMIKPDERAKIRRPVLDEHRPIRVSDASVNFHFDATRSFHLKIGKIK